METISMTCIVCPNGCALEVGVDGDEVVDVTGNRCMRGLIYAQNEVLNPVRTVTSTVEVTGGTAKRVPVKTEKEIPKGKVMDCARALKGVKVEAPVHIGDVVVENIAGTGVNICATGNVGRSLSVK